MPHRSPFSNLIFGTFPAKNRKVTAVKGSHLSKLSNALFAQPIMKESHNLCAGAVSRRAGGLSLVPKVIASPRLGEEHIESATLQIDFLLSLR